MDFDLRNARVWSRQLICEALPAGGTVVDATMGNGKDTLWLAELVGSQGKVIAFDVQQEALERTRARLEDGQMLDRVRLVCDGHQNVDKYVETAIDVAVFNLGWLPGGDKQITTFVSTTLQAADGCLALLKPSGLLSICAYPGHEEGEREAAALVDWAKNLDPRRYDCMLQTYLNKPAKPPLLLAVKKVW